MEKTPHYLELITNYFSDFTAQQTKQFESLQLLYTDWNSRINLISRKDIEGLYLKHVLHSLAIAAVFDFEQGTEIIDIGTGGGFPGLPLAIYFPDVQFHLVDSIGKKIKAVDEIKNAIGLKNVTTEHGRAEAISGRTFDFAVSRAVAPLKDLLNWSRPLIRKRVFTVRDAGGVHVFNSGLICLKGGNLKDEIAESQIQPNLIEINNLFQEAYFKEKYLIYIPF